MLKAEIYSASVSKLAVVDALKFMELYKHFLNWNCNEKVLDAGCGDGSVTSNVLLPKLPKTFSNLECVDIDKEMLNFARKKIVDSRVSFKVLDLCSSEVPKEFENYFDRVFSFNVLHWVPDQRALFNNLYKMMKPGGELLVTGVTSVPIFTGLEGLHKKEKWMPYMTNYDKYFSVYRKSKNPLVDLVSYLNTAGFKLRFCRLENLEFKFDDRAHMEGTWASGNYCIEKIPKEQQDAFMREFLQEAEKDESVNIVSDPNNAEKNYYWTRSSMIAIAEKLTF